MLEILSFLGVTNVINATSTADVQAGLLFGKITAFPRFPPFPFHSVPLPRQSRSHLATLLFGSRLIFFPSASKYNFRPIIRSTEHDLLERSDTRQLRLRQHAPSREADCTPLLHPSGMRINYPAPRSHTRRQQSDDRSLYRSGGIQHLRLYGSIAQLD
jgi:hypothetical protein